MEKEGQFGAGIAAAPEVLWHYTNADGLIGIIDSQCLWATDAEYLNDASELKYAWSVATDVLRDEAASHGLVADVCAEALKAGEQFRGGWCVYATCFCTRGDLLSQWRAYGQSGYALGFDRVRCDGGFDVSPWLNRPLIWPVQYCPTDQAEVVRAAIRDAVGGYQSSTTLPPIQNIVGSVRVAIALKAPLIKHPAFTEEQEWRLFFSRIRGVQHLEFRTGRIGLIPYQVVPMKGSPEMRPQLPIRHVIVARSTTRKRGKRRSYRFSTSLVTKAQRIW
jgi:hypothetical protein